jgi:hypothetical protein
MLDHFLFRPTMPRRGATLRRLRLLVAIVSRHEFRAWWGTWPPKRLTVGLGGRRRAVTALQMAQGPA